MQSLKAIEEVTVDMDRAVRLYEGLGEALRRSPWTTLVNLSSRKEIFTPEAQGVLGLAARAADVPATTQTKGRVAIGMGLLRGALRAMGGLILTGLVATSAVPLGEALKTTLERDGMQRAIIEFLGSAVSTLKSLASELPAFFGWLHHLLAALGLG